MVRIWLPKHMSDRRFLGWVEGGQTYIRKRRGEIGSGPVPPPFPSVSVPLRDSRI